MSGVIGEKASLGQGKGPEVELIVTGTAAYSTYETLDGYPAIYDDALELFCYARVVAGAYQSTGVPVTEAPPPGVERHAKESAEARTRKTRARQSQIDGRSQAAKEKQE
jgi:hypothetical protein